jgi:hypothetical protein
VDAARLSHLCGVLSRDPGLEGALTAGGVTSADWDVLHGEVTAGGRSAEMVAVLDKIDRVASSLGVAGVTSAPRDLRPLPNGVTAPRAVSRWRCPHQHRCDRVEAGSAGQAPVCGFTGEHLQRVSVVSG